MDGLCSNQVSKHFRHLHLTLLDLVHCIEEVMGHALIDNRVVAVLWVGSDKVAHPLGIGVEGPIGTGREELKVLVDTESNGNWEMSIVQVIMDKRNQTRESSLAVDDLVEGHFFNNIIVWNDMLGIQSGTTDVSTEPELLSGNGITTMSTLHVDVNLGKGHKHVQRVRKHDTRQQDHKDHDCRILKVSHLQVARPELYAPSNLVGAWGRRLEAHSLPVGGLDVLEMIRCLGIIDVESLIVDDKRIADKQMSKMAGKHVIHTTLTKPLVDGLVKHEGDVVMEVWSESRIVGDVAINRGITRLVDATVLALERGFPTFLRRPVINGVDDVVPSNIGVRDVSSLNGCCSRESKHDRCQWLKMVVKETGLVNGGSLESALKTREPHAKGHGIHVDVAWKTAWELWRVLCVCVLEQRDIDSNLGSSAFTNVASKGPKSRMGVDHVVRDELGICKLPMCGSSLRVCIVTYSKKRKGC